MDVASSDTATAVSTEPAPRAAQRPLRRDIPVLVGAALGLTLLIRLLLVQSFYIPSGSMQPTLAVGDRVLVSKVGGDVQRGDVVVFDGRGFAPTEPAVQGGLLLRASRAIGGLLGVAPSDRDYVKRVIGTSGDHVVCCDAEGRLAVNGTALGEPYILPGDAASEQPFDVEVPAGRLWVMGDHRSDSADSRAHLGDPGGGMVPVERVVGHVAVRFWPLTDLGALPATGAGS